jgi:hypothetical protein
VHSGVGVHIVLKTILKTPLNCILQSTTFSATIQKVSANIIKRGVAQRLRHAYDLLHLSLHFRLPPVYPPA